ncbi:hypothetical protein [Halorubrum vacuolatum]|uniref:Uncharacterized protein n=1 Tax=Halorubrum vacuolatum TaxID=63740 RepID=A0A238X4L7_HALVU|nr:hypothetical protein [Halorubrum vacuolatum]SNR53541.1 hypothetical protein SAMN06264855_11335 [Halorubrum vacuolatum]
MDWSTFKTDGWPALAGVGVGYLLACALIFAAFFVVPYLLVTVA